MAAEAPIAPVPLKIVCLETWGDHQTRLFQNTSVRPFLEALGSQFYPPIRGRTSGASTRACSPISSRREGSPFSFTCASPSR